MDREGLIRSQTSSAKFRVMTSARSRSLQSLWWSSGFSCCLDY